MKKTEKFLNELSNLSIKHGMYIENCNCGLYPFVEDVDGKELLGPFKFDWNFYEYKSLDE